MISSSSCIVVGEESSSCVSYGPAKLCSAGDSRLISFRMPLLSQTIVFFCLLRCPLGYCVSLLSSLSLCISPAGLHGQLKPLLLFLIKTISLTFLKHLNELLIASPLVCVCRPKMWHNVSPKWRETNKIPLFGCDWPVCRTRRGTSAVQTVSECPQLVTVWW